MTNVSRANRTRMYRDVEFLTGITPHRNHANLKSLEQAYRYIWTELEVAGYMPEMQTWAVRGHEYHNVIAKFRPDLERRLVVGAHYDVCFTTPGADDNASAVAGLLETARLIAEINPNLDFGID
ncbi:MAG: M28 family peptidase, partial [Bacteroidetes bacterium]|nr:M28 family peptidase [Bacteroidota bacterium]